MSEIKQMYLNAYYGQHFTEEPKPGLEQIVDPNAVDAVKVIYGERKA